MNASSVTIIGTTTWGTTLGLLLARNGHRVRVWARTSDEAAELEQRRRHPFLPDIDLLESMAFTADPIQAFEGSEVAVVAVPSVSLRANIRRLQRELRQAPRVVSATKGIEEETGARPSDRILEEIGDAATPVGALSGPNLAREIAQGKPSSATVAFPEGEDAERVQALFTSTAFRVYTSDDVTGVELGGALKNIIALGAGIIDGMGLGNNAKAAFVTRGLAEITRLGMAMGARLDTFAGLSGMGDVLTTCYSGLSRNRHVGEQLAVGRKLPEILESLGQTVEGVPTTSAALLLARHHDVDMPIAEMTAEVLFHGLDPSEAMTKLMSRAPVPEQRGRRQP